jgi:predicted CoA-binding protein
MSSAVQDFLAQRRIAVAGVSRDPARHGANVVYRRLRERGYEVFAVNPNAETVEGDRSYPDLRSIPGRVDGVVIGTAPQRADGIVREAHTLGIGRVWMHQGPVPGSVSQTAVEYCRANGISVIPGGCPLMYGATADFGHRCMRWWLERTGAVPTGI